MMNRIYFEDNPYPNGHKINEFVWDARLKKDRGLIFDFHLVSDDYYAENHSEEEVEEDQADWVSKIVWGNFHQCTLSSTYWNGNGVLVGSREHKIEFQQLLGKTLIVDALDKGATYKTEELALNIYLLGHDSCADHHISFTKQYDKATYDIEWKGKIALSYSGDYEFKHSFRLTISKVKFGGIRIDKTLSKEANQELLKECLLDASIFELIDDKFEIKL